MKEHSTLIRKLLSYTGWVRDPCFVPGSAVDEVCDLEHFPLLFFSFPWVFFLGGWNNDTPQPSHSLKWVKYVYQEHFLFNLVLLIHPLKPGSGKELVKAYDSTNSSVTKKYPALLAVHTVPHKLITTQWSNKLPVHQHFSMQLCTILWPAFRLSSLCTCYIPFCQQLVYAAIPQCLLTPAYLLHPRTWCSHVYVSSHNVVVSILWGFFWLDFFRVCSFI